MYFNYHAKIKKLIDSGTFLKYEIVEDWNGIKPALVLFFSDHKPMPVRKENWEKYLKILK